jgi:chemotaxis signal transduction protein
MSAEKDAWMGLHERLSRVREALENGTGRARDLEEEILRKRAERLARPIGMDVPPAGREYLRFRLGESRFLLDSSAVAAVIRPGELLPVPDSPAKVLGVFGFREELATLLSLSALTGLAEARPDEGNANLAILLQDGEDQAAVPASEILGLAALGEEGIEPLKGATLRGLAGMTAEGDYVLDAARLSDGLEETGSNREK